MTDPRDPAESRHDVVVVGGGLIGAVLALALARIGLGVALIERDAPDPDADGRASAIALGSKRILEALGLWDAVADAAGPILDIRVSDGPSRLFLHYDHRDVADVARGEPLGFIVENHMLRRTQASALDAAPEIYRVLGQVTGIERGDAEGSPAAVRLDDGRRVAADLVVGADGRRSAVRVAAGIRSLSWRYGQTALVCTVRHPHPHRAIAHERFLPAGPFALLPLKDPNRASIVWTESDARADALKRVDDATLSTLMTEQFGDYLGLLSIEGRRWFWPLGLHHADRYVDRRLVLVGDAAHGIHPIAGQGLNLGLRDVAALAEVLADSRRLGIDIGDAGVLDRYQRWRRPDTVALLAATDGLNRLFSNDLGPVRLARSLGLAAVNRVPSLKRLFMRQAMGLVGPLPRLARGEPL